MTRMNLNTFARHGVLDRSDMVELIANRLRNAEAIRRARVFPYQLLAAFRATAEGMPHAIREALHDAMEIAVDNVPALNGQVVVCPDVSGSMHSAVTGVRRGATSVVRCIDVAALVTAAVLRRHPEAEIVPFNHEVVPARLTARDSVMTNARTLSRLPQGGTKASAPLQYLNQRHARADLVIYVSDNQSWVDTVMDSVYPHDRTATMKEWTSFKKRNRHARLVCIDIQPYRTTQAVERDDILNIGGFSDQVFEVIADFAGGRLQQGGWLKQIKETSL